MRLETLANIACLMLDRGDPLPVDFQAKCVEAGIDVEELVANYTPRTQGEIDAEREENRALWLRCYES